MIRLTHRRVVRSHGKEGLLRWLCFITAALAMALPCPAGVDRRSAQLFRFSLARMGTVFNIALYHADQTAASKAAMAAFDRVEQLERIFSDYRENSEARRICREAAGAARPVSPELFHVLDHSLRFSRLTGGAFDVTIGPVVQVWRQARRAGKEPDAADLAHAREAVGYQNIILNAGDRTVQLLLPKMRLDFGAIVKGYAADEALKVLKAQGIQSALVDAGGDIRVGAAPPGETGWGIAVRTGYEGQDGAGSLKMHDAAVATSGDSLQSLQLKGRRYSHIINPATGMGLRDSAAVTVVARDCLTADALATALSVMPVDDGISLIESIPGASAAILYRNGEDLERRVSAGFPNQATRKTAARAVSIASTKD